MESCRILGVLVLGVMLAPHAAPALGQSGEIFKCRDAKGHWTYTNDRRQAEKQKCESVSREVNVVPASKPGAFPRESARDSAAARERQRQILQQELASEQQALETARKELAEQEATRSGDERNYARVQERLQPFKDSVETHEKNIAALRRELANLR